MAHDGSLSGMKFENGKLGRLLTAGIDVHRNGNSKYTTGVRIHTPLRLNPFAIRHLFATNILVVKVVLITG